MAAKWYYKTNGAVRGPINDSEMRKLAASGEITPETPVRVSGQDRWASAALLRGLFGDAANANTQSSATTGQHPDCAWYLRDPTGKTFGPVTKHQLDEWHHNRQISPSCQLKHNEWPEWQVATAVYPSDDEVGIDWQYVQKRLAAAWVFVRDIVQGCFDSLSIRWSPEAPHLRRCITNTHHQFSTHAQCRQCGRPTVGMRVSDVVYRKDDRLQAIYLTWIASRRRLSFIIACCFAACVLVSFPLWVATWWSALFIPIVFVMGYCIARFAARVLNTGIQRGIDAPVDPSKTRLAERQFDEINEAFIAPFLRRNETPLDRIPNAQLMVVKRLKSLDTAAGVLTSDSELQMLDRILADRGIRIWANRTEVHRVLSAFALKSDYSLFKERILRLESTGFSPLAAYASLVSHDATLLPFLQQFCTERQLPNDETSLLAKLAAVRQDFRLREFSKDLEQRRQGSMSITIEMVDAMDPYNFELLLGMIYESQGYRVIETPKGSDQGADVFLEKAGERTVVQAKLYSDSVGNKAVQEVVAARGHYRCHAAKVVTNRWFTPSARELAESNDVELVGREELSRMIVEFNRSAMDYSRLEILMRTPSVPTAIIGGDL